MAKYYFRVYREGCFWQELASELVDSVKWPALLHVAWGTPFNLLRA